MILRSIFAGALLCALTIHAADARPRHYRHHIPMVGKMVGCSDPIFGSCEVAQPRNYSKKYSRNYSKKRVLLGFAGARPMPPGLHRVMATGAGRIVGGRPHGCPRRYCGCGASLHIFGRIIPRLNLAANWLRFPRAAPAPGMVAARRGHVFVLKRHLHGRVWLVWDANSGRGKTRVHPRSIAGFTIVDPRG